MHAPLRGLDLSSYVAQQGGGGRGGYAPPSPPSSRSPLRAGASVHIDRDSNIVISPGGARVTAHGATQQAAAATPPVVSAAWTAPCLMVETVVEAVDEAAEATSLAFFLMKLKLGMGF